MPVTLSRTRRRPRTGTDGRHRALVEVLERRRRRLPGEPALITLPTYLPSCSAGCATPGQLVQRHHVADREHLGMPRQRAVRVHRDAPGTVGLGTGLLGEHLRQRRGGDTRRPDPGAAADRLHAVRTLHRDRVVVHADGERVEVDLHSHLLQLPVRVGLQLLVERRQHRRRALQQDDPRLAGVDRAVVARQHGVRQLRDLPDGLHAGRAGADHDEREQLGPLGRVRRDSASSNAERIRSRRYRASSIVFMPGANSANSSRPK